MPADLSWASNPWTWVVSFRRVTDSRPEVIHRPILFSGPMVRAILEGRKTQTRRAIALDKLRVHLPQRVSSEPVLMLAGAGRVAEPGVYRARLNPQGAVLAVEPDLGLRPGEFNFLCPYAEGNTRLVQVQGAQGARSYWEILPEVGQRLWVRETWAPADLRHSPLAPVLYRADGDAQPVLDRWHPSIHMPREYARLTLEVVSVRVERLQEISEADARAEGVTTQVADLEGFNMVRARDAFRTLWDSINGARKLAPGRAA